MKRILSLLYFAGVVSFDAIAQIGIEDGECVDMLNSDRYSEVVQRLYPDPPQRPMLEFTIVSPFRKQCIIKTVSIPKPDRAIKYTYTEKVMLSFYTGIPEQPADRRSTASVIVSVGDRREFVVDDVEAEWKLRLVDLGDYHGTVRDIRFNLYDVKGFFEVHSMPPQVSIALPRIIAWHGPYYIGYGGGMSPGRHGKRRVAGRWELDIPKIDRTIIPHPLMIQWYDFVQPSTLELGTKSRNVTYTLGQGVHWLPIRLYDDEQQHTLISGEVESGAIDIIPDFTVGDEKLLPTLK
jgi:hypothetical protein